jgi:hypothetical protein
LVDAARFTMTDVFGGALARQFPEKFRIGPRPRGIESSGLLLRE